MISKPFSALLVSLAVPAAAGDFRLEIPIDCDLGSDCYIQQYVDHDTSDGYADFLCSTLSYDGHKGTDFALPDLARMAKGVSVLAAADGRVIATRRGMADVGYSAETAASVAGRECGNGIVIAHADGWETQYCHLKAGSISLAKGDQVKTGDRIGKVGLSGRSEFPHLHLSVRKNGAVIDPFSPNVTGACNAGQSTSLWKTPVKHRPGGIIALGFADHVPSFDAVKAGPKPNDTLPDSSNTVVVYAHAFGGQKGDRLHIKIEGPSGPLAEQSFPVNSTKARMFRAFGIKLRADQWPHGTYTGTVELLRSDRVVSMKKTAITVR
ncbi:MAG: M23 family metallopeptidase [Sulfitobacter sp.]